MGHKKQIWELGSHFSILWPLNKGYTVNAHFWSHNCLHNTHWEKSPVWGPWKGDFCPLGNRSSDNCLMINLEDKRESCLMIVEPGVKRAASKYSTEKSVPCGLFLCSERPCIHWDQSILGTSANLSNWARLVLPLRGNVWSPNTGLKSLFLSVCAAYPERKSFFLFTKLNQAGHLLICWMQGLYEPDTELKKNKIKMWRHQGRLVADGASSHLERVGVVGDSSRLITQLVNSELVVVLNSLINAELYFYPHSFFSGWFQWRLNLGLITYLYFAELPF